MPVLKLCVMDHRGSCARVVAVAQLEDVNMAGSRLPSMHRLFKGSFATCQEQKKEDLTCDGKFSAMQNDDMTCVLSVPWCRSQMHLTLI